MIMNMVGGGGGTAVRIKAVTSESELPTAENVGAIYLITIVPLSGNAYLQPAQPNGTFEPGDVWIMTKQDSNLTINAVAKGALIIGLYKAYVWSDSNWVEAEMYARTSSGWEQSVTALYLIQNGEKKVEFTDDDVTETSGDGYMFISFSEGIEGQYYPTEQIDLTLYSTLCLTSYNQNEERNAVLQVVGASDEKVASVDIPANGRAEMVRIDVSSLTGSYYIEIYGIRRSDGDAYTGSEVYIYDWWLE